MGYFVNTFYLVKVYSNSAVNNFGYSLLQLENVIKVLNVFIKNYGWHYGSGFFSVQSFYNILPVVMIIVIIWGCRLVLHNESSYNREQILLTLFYVSGLLIFIVLYALSNMALYDRYFLPITIYGYFVFIMVIDSIITSERVRKIVFSIFFIYFIMYAVLNLYEYTKIDTSEEIREISSFLVDNEYYEGYSTSYWHEGNALTECSSGQIMVWRMQGINENSVGEELLDNKLMWLCSKSQYDTHPEGKVFFILGYQLKCLDPSALIYTIEEDSIYIYGYDSYEDLVKDISL